MPRPSLRPDVAIDVHLAATMSRHRYDLNATACLTELERIAGARVDILTAAVASWVAFYRDDTTHTLCDGLLAAIPDAVNHPAAAVAARRRGTAWAARNDRVEEHSPGA